METTPNENLPVLVVGATGFLGLEICRQLIQNGRPVKGLVRTSSDRAKVAALQELGVQTVVGDLKDANSLATACRGAGAVISTATTTMSRQEGDSVQSVDNRGQLKLVNAAKEAGVKHFVFISFNEVNGEFPLQTAKRTVEEHLQNSGMTYTILRPTLFMEAWLSPALGFDFSNGIVTVYGEGKNKNSWISLRDVAQFAVAALVNDHARNAILELGGPEALSPLEVVQLFEKRGQKQFVVKQVPLEALYAQRGAATDPLQVSFAYLALGYAAGATIPMEQTLKKFPIQLTSVQDYIRSVMPAPAADFVLTI